MALQTCWMPGFIAGDPLAQALVRISDDAIAQDNDARLRDYLAEDYVFHGPRRPRGVKSPSLMDPSPRWGASSSSG
jgi:hypothetical protein